jgi:glucose/arabinose dehydrogenase
VPLRIALAALAAAVALVALLPVGGAAESPGDPALEGAAVRLERIGSFDSPVHLAGAPGDSERLFVVEQEGTIRIVRGGRTNATPFLDIRSRVGCCGERGLLSIAFAPDYQQSGRFYVFFTENSGDLRVFEYRRSDDPDRADAGSARAIMRVGHRRFGNHNGGQVAFGPDGALYASTGDGGGGGDPFRSAQNRRSLLGKILRIADPAGSRPRPRVYAYGLRNPYRFSFDRSTGDIIIGDVGQNAIEEIDFKRRDRARGANFGWSVFEGRRRFRGGRAAGHDRPVITHSHRAGWCSIIGGFVVRDRESDLFGRYVYGDYCKGDLYSARLGSGGARGVRREGVRVSSLSSFGEDTDGHVYATSLGGAVYRLR